MTILREHSRRSFLKLTGGFGSLGVGGPLAMQLAALGSMSAPAAAANDYKALVCVFLNGGNDHLNTLVPYDTANYNALKASRPNSAPAYNLLLPLTGVGSKGQQVALNASLVNVRNMYNQKSLAILPRVGTMIEPVTRSELDTSKKKLPPGAGSHNDGVSMWHALGLEGSRYGWAGLMLDALTDAQSAAFASISTGFYNPFGSGMKTYQFQVGSAGSPTDIAGAQSLSYLGSPLGPSVMRQLLATPGSNSLLAADYTALTKRTMEGTETLKAVLAKAGSRFEPVQDRPGDQRILYRDNTLLKQMRLVAQLISERQALGATRQVFFTELPHFDNHGDLVVNHPNLLLQLDVALGYFRDCLAEMGLSNNVMTFTTSEFGRGLAENGMGTGHGWGGVQFIMGGGVKGGALYGGEPPVIDLKGPDIISSTATLPTTSVEQVAATIGRWFGVSGSTLGQILPNLPRFSPTYLDFV